MFTVTSRAAEQIRKSAEAGQMTGLGLRIAAKKTPDGHIEYAIGFDQPHPQDIQVHSEGAHILIAQPHQALLNGASMDFVELEGGRFSFIFLNPNDPNYVAPSEV
jgi:iron-sulfur cluster assembly protein